MIIAPDPSVAFDVPEDADFTLRFKTPFTSMQVTAATRTVEMFDQNNVKTVFSADADGADMLLQVTPSMFAPGRWTFNPVIVIVAKRYAWAEAGAMNVLERGFSRAGGSC